MVMRSFSAKVMLFAAAFASILVQAIPAESGQYYKRHSQFRSSNMLPLNARPPVARQFTSIDGNRRNHYYRNGARPYSQRLYPARYNPSRFETRRFRAPEFRTSQFRTTQFRTPRHYPARFDFDTRRNQFRYDRYRDRGPIVYGGDTLAYGYMSQIPDIGTYVGNIAAYPVPDNGIYFTSNSGGYSAGGYGYFGEGVRRNPDAMLAPKARIINVTAETEKSACRFEAGVCVVRP
ncbi:hypothetical protein MRS76_10865 [Rhizobiaceae bacterium n13]|uniref:Uncharacterized protein n=1 Tax=Ferirhizobium litorale TaxID=2927786 RepID=A0AAE3U4Q3_9HYPH|nr:hypothetical protein [Fererhizobium litorale]MDI7862460.1 hypothetical protein [Fererhizobium litorale]MDI7923653.1 hypothetical protein [Fererhizobium litorale]